ncbi:retention module-containing protein [Billgrantia sulfidoxydans]|uniref:Retention module-containing protein n=1 Tax=Billgrantia sulfidoxydans TaxID=2733484 RepID=A0ABX7W5A0_9GAMM|nr:retention module-containing protein [Halomonas sulfidoxydans]QTP55295.1 retention module-containing protein [Halomonas sulfidoxydans]
MSIATVISLSGQAWARDASGNLRELHVGDALQEGETVITSNGGGVQLDFGDSFAPTLIEGGEQVVLTQELGADQPADASEFAALDEDLEALLSALDDDSADLLDVLDATAAGAGPGGGADGGHSFVRLARIVENVDPLAYNFGLNALGRPSEEQGGAFVAEEAEEVEEPQAPAGTPPTAGSIEATLHDVETLGGSSSVASGVLPASFGSGSDGSVTFAGMNGAQLQLGGETLLFNWNAATNTLQAISEARGVTVFTVELDPATGAFTIIQVNNLLHGMGMDDALASLVYTVSSSSGSATGTLQLTFVDDAPQAADDSASTDEDTAVIVNVVGNDSAGADGMRLTSASLRNPSQGTLSFQANGEVTFTPAPGFEGEAVIDYAITDADGDTSSATLTVTVAPDSIPVIAVNADSSSVAEAGLPSGSAGDGSHATSGTLAIDTGNDGLQSLFIKGVNVTNGGTVAGTHGTLVVTLTDGSYSWTYTLDGATDGDATSDSFSLVVTDSDGSTASDSLVIDIVDDVPQAADDHGGTVAEDAAGNVLSGSVLANDTLGADGFGSLTWDVSAEQLAELGQYGSLVLNPDGSWSFTLDNNLAAVQALGADELLNFSLGYTITDADGDTSSATLSLSILGADDSAQVIVNASGADSTVHEAGLTSESDTRESASGSFHVAATDGIASVTVGGQSFTLAQLQGFSEATPSLAISTVMGTLYLTGFSGTASAGTVSYVYALGEAQMHGVPTSSTDETLTDSVSLSVTGVGGSTASATLTVDIIDDTPSLTSLNLAIGNVAGTYDGVYEFDVGPDAQGFLDSFGEGSLIWTGMPAGYELIITGSSDTSITYTAQSGALAFFNLTLHTNGTYSFELVSPAPVVETEIESMLSAFDPSGFYQEEGKLAYLFSADLFDGKFALAVEAFSNGSRENVSLSSTDLGVHSNVVQGNKNDMLRFDVRPMEDAGAIGIASFVFSVSGTGGTKADDQAKLTVYDVDGSSTIYTATLATSDGEFLFDIDPSHNIDYLELRPAGNNSFKIDGVSTSYVTQIYPDDYQLDFELAGSDADGDLASAAFTVFVKTTEDGTYEITGTDGDDVVHGTEGDDTLAGGAGHDTLIGGEGDDVFQWQLGDQGEEGVPATDTIKDFGLGEDVLDLVDLLQSGSTDSIDNFILAAQEGTDTVLYISHEGGISADGSNATQVIVLENVNMEGASSADFLQEMLESGQLHIDP